MNVIIELRQICSRKKNIIEDEDIDDSFDNYHEDHYERTASSPEDIIMDALENGDGEIYGF